MPGNFKPFGRFFSRNKRHENPPGRRKLTIAERPDTVFAIGDVHGRFDLLRRLEQRIVESTDDLPGRKLIVMLGDYVDRGPQSREVIDHLIDTPPAGFERICLAGNHEQVMQSFLADPRKNANWLGFGGHETLASYGVYEDSYTGTNLGRRNFRYLLQSTIPDEHREFLAGLPSMLVMPGFVFVHAGIQPGITLSEQMDSNLMWIRGEFLDAPETGIEEVIVHGHTPVSEPEITPMRINIDTGAYMSGCLTALRINNTGEISFCFAR